MTDQSTDQPAVSLTVWFVGETFRPGTELGFGRQADLSLDENSYLHRRAGRFRLRDGRWWLENLGTRLRLTMAAADGSLIELQPGAASPLLGSRGEVSLTAGPTRYVMEYELAAPASRETTAQYGIGGADTKTFGPVLTPRELDFVVVLAQGRLSGRLGPMPSHSEIASIWGVSHKTVDNTLQRLKTKLRTQRINFVDSTETLIEYLVTQGLVTRDDLEWANLDGPDGPRPAATRTP
ncbi:MAG: hypothetical protein AAF467_17040 [Actinomycetota bacterium]